MKLQIFHFSTAARRISTGSSRQRRSRTYFFYGPIGRILPKYAAIFSFVYRTFRFFCPSVIRVSPGKPRRNSSGGGAQTEAEPKRWRSSSRGRAQAVAEFYPLPKNTSNTAHGAKFLRHAPYRQKTEKPQNFQQKCSGKMAFLLYLIFFDDGRGRQNFFACLCHLFPYTHKTGRGTMIPRPVFSHSIISNPFCLIFLLKFAILKPTRMRTLQSAFPIFPFHVPPADFSVFPACLRSPRSR